MVIDKKIADYAVLLYRDIPMAVYEGLLSVLCLGAVILIAFYGWKRSWRKVVGLLLVEYVFLIYCSTVIYRKASEGVAGHNFHSFWSYEAIKNGKEDLIAENIMNVVVFVPVGMLLGLITLKTQTCRRSRCMVIGKRKGWRTRIARISLIVGTGLTISGSIEVLQFFLMRGFSEFDDVFHNTMGCLIGFMIITMIKGIWQFSSYLLSHN